jgi:hypothetical protein
VLADVPDPGTGVRLRDALHDVTHLVFAAKIFCHQCKWALRTARNAMMPSSATRPTSRCRCEDGERGQARDRAVEPFAQPRDAVLDRDGLTIRA